MSKTAYFMAVCMQISVNSYSQKKRKKTPTLIGLGPAPNMSKTAYFVAVCMQISLNSYSQKKRKKKEIKLLL